MARPRSEDKKQALLEAAAAAIAQSGIAASTALIARGAGVAEGTLFRYFTTKDDLLNELYLHLKQDLCKSMLGSWDHTETDAKTNTCHIWNSYVDWGLRYPVAHQAIRQLAVSDKITEETRQKVTEIYPELNDLCEQSVLPVFRSCEYRAFGDALFGSLINTTMEFATLEPDNALHYKKLGFEAMWRALANELK